MSKKYFSFLLFFSLNLCGVHTSATTYELFHHDENIVGELKSVVVDSKITLLDVAREHGFGYHDLKLLNPEVDTWMPNDGEVVQLPSKFILPSVPREGLVLNIPEMRMYYFPKVKKNETPKVITYPLGVGREGWATPYVKTKIIGKKHHPDWRPPKSIRKEHEEAGDPLPEIVKAGPDNPLGEHALRLGLPSYLIHGTNKPWGIGMRVSHGCIRLYPEDIADLFQHVKVGTPVNIINNPYKIGNKDGILYLEAHPILRTAERDENGKVIESEDTSILTDFNQVVEMIVSSTEKDEYIIDWDMARTVSEEAKGIPVAIGYYFPEQHDSLTLKLDNEIGEIQIEEKKKDYQIID